MRTFISIDMPEKVKKKIKEIQDKLHGFHGKKTELQNLHLTLKFLGEIDEDKVEEVKEKLRRVDMNGFEVEIDLIGVFSEKFVRIVWMHVSNCDNLQKEIDDKLEGLFDKEQRFMSHLTIARVKKVDDRNEFLRDLSRIEIPNIRFKVKEFRLKKSILKGQGPVYEGIEKYDLK